MCNSSSAVQDIYFLGIETGGTKSMGVLTDLAGSDVRVQSGPPGNISVLGQDVWVRNMKGLLDALLEGDNPQKIEWATLGVAGAGRTCQRRAAEAGVGELGLTHVSVMTDAELFHYSVHGNEPGMSLLAGTGAICLVSDDGVQHRQFGGWGYLLGDEGSGYDLGRKCIRLALSDFEQGRLPSHLTQALLSFYGLSEPDELVTAIFSSENPQQMISSSARLVCEHAAKGDATAQQCVNEAAEALRGLCDSARKTQCNVDAPLNIALAGSLLKNGSPVRQALERLLSDDTRYVTAGHLPAVAAVLHAFFSSGHPIPKSFMERTEQLEDH